MRRHLTAWKFRAYPSSRDHLRRLGSAARARNNSRGQALVEFGISSIFLLLLVMGIIDLGFLYSYRISMANAARAGARWAATHPTSWTNASSPDSNTIEGQVINAGGVSSVANNDSHITISYYDTSSSSAVYCGKYVASSNSFSAASGYTQSTCIVDGTLIQVSVNNTYPLLTPVMTYYFGTGVKVSSTSAFADQT